ncbi:hypothetical protein V5799_022970 [Amblyomma americanum]|uniref:Uncharacterized protein n=1 Tax=Amblyomma americanum TaxID=6943 RepID=A0AAQ4FKH2_AMBAM
MVSTLCCLCVLFAFAAPSESVRPPRQPYKGNRPRNPTAQGAQHPQGYRPHHPPGPRPVPPPGPMNPPPPGSMRPHPGGPGPYPHQSPRFPNPQSRWPQQPQVSYPQRPAWGPPAQNVCPLMCKPGQKPGDPCGPVPNCLCALDMGYGSMINHPCIFIPSG